jgi:dihydroneopterin aldolase
MRSTDTAIREPVKVPGRTTAAPASARAASTAAYTVFIRDLQVETCIGAFEHERTGATVLMLDVDIEVACHAGTSDRLGDAVDYGAVVEEIRRGMANKRYFLLEKASEFVAALVLEKFGALRVRVSMAKTGIIDGVGRVGVMLERRGEGFEVALQAASSEGNRRPCVGSPARRRSP